LHGKKLFEGKNRGQSQRFDECHWLQLHEAHAGFIFCLFLAVQVLGLLP